VIRATTDSIVPSGRSAERRIVALLVAWVTMVAVMLFPLPHRYTSVKTAPGTTFSSGLLVCDQEKMSIEAAIASAHAQAFRQPELMQRLMRYPLNRVSSIRGARNTIIIPLLTTQPVRPRLFEGGVQPMRRAIAPSKRREPALKRPETSYAGTLACPKHP